MSAQAVDQVALAPLYAAAGGAVVVLVADLVVPSVRRGWLVGLAAMSTLITGVVGLLVGLGPSRSTFCIADAGCSLVANRATASVVVVFCVLTSAVLGLSAPLTRDRALPVGEYTFLVLCSLVGGVALAGSRDLVTLIVSLETVTLPLYVLVGLHRTRAGAEGAVTFLLVSVVSTAVTLLGAALLYAGTGAVHLDALASALGRSTDPAVRPLLASASVLVVAGLTFKVAAVPFHAWAGGVYDGAPLPVAAYLSTASKLGGVVAIVLVVGRALPAERHILAPVLAVVAALTMTLGNLLALRQSRPVRMLAWSSVAQAGYLLAPLGAFAAGDGPVLVGATLAYTGLYVLIELGAFGSLVAARGAADGGAFADLRGLLRSRPSVAFAWLLALVGLAGLPPGLAGLFAKVVVVRALVGAGVWWLALVVAANAVLGLAYYLRGGAAVLGRSEAGFPRPGLPVAVTLGGVSVAAVVVGVAPQWIFAAASTAASLVR
jgi:NADH-quinone oxidoreductase subunit N